MKFTQLCGPESSPETLAKGCKLEEEIKLLVRGTPPPFIPHHPSITVSAVDTINDPSASELMAERGPLESPA